MPRNNVPTVTSDIPRDLRHWIDRASEAIARNGRNRFVSAEELRSAGLIEFGPGDTIEAPQDGTEPTVFVPGAPNNLAAAAGYEYIILTWDRSTQYGIAYATIYRSIDADFANAVGISSTTANVFSDYVGTDQTFYYWVSYTNILDQEGPTAGPVSDTSAINVTEVFEALVGEVLTTEMVDDLSTFLGNDVYISNAQDNYVVKIGSEGTAAGFGLASTPRNSGIEFDFAVLADNFFITPPVDFNQNSVPTATRVGQVWRRLPIPDDDVSVSGTTVTAYDYFGFKDSVEVQLNSATVANSAADAVYEVTYYISKSSTAAQVATGEWEIFSPVPFIVRTTDTTITNDDGQSTDVPAGVYISSAYIQDGTITSAKIGTAAIDTAAIADAAIDNAKIDFLDAAKITTGVLESHNFTNAAYSSGWRLGKGLVGSYDQDGNWTTSAEATQFIIRDANQQYPTIEATGSGAVTINAANIRYVLQSVGYSTSTAGFQFDIDNNTFTFRGSGDPSNEPAFELAGGTATINAANIRHTLASVGYSPTSAGFELDVDNNTFVFQKSSTEYFKYENGVFETSGLTIKATDGTTLLSAGGEFSNIRLTNGTNLVFNGDFAEGANGWVNWDPNNYEDATFSEFFGTATAASSVSQGVRQVQDSFIKVVPGEDLYLYCIAEGAGGWIAVEWFQDDGTGTLSYLGAQAFSGDGINRDNEDQAFDARKILRSVQITAPDQGATIDGTDLTTADNVGIGDLIQINLNSSVVLTKQFTALANVEGPAHYVRVLFGTFASNVGTAIFYDVGLARVPPILNPSYASTYIRDLSVDTLQIANNAVTVPIGNSDVNVNTDIPNPYPSTTTTIWHPGSWAGPFIWTSDKDKPDALSIIATAQILALAGSASVFRDIGMRLVSSSTSSFSNPVELTSVAHTEAESHTSSLSINHTLDLDSYDSPVYVRLEVFSAYRGAAGPYKRLGRNGITVLGTKK